MNIKSSELILNPDGSVYHLNLKPGDIADTIIFVGDQDRVEKITKHFDTITFETRKREFKTRTGTYKNKRISVISTGIGAGNIDIVMNELDAVVNIDLETGIPKKNTTALTIVRAGTSGALQKDIPTGAFLISTHGLDLTGMLHAYRTGPISHSGATDAFIQHTGWSAESAQPLLIENHKQLEKKLEGPRVYKGVTATAGGFYGPQGRVLRLPLQFPSLNEKMSTFRYNDLRITNFEMETAVIYGLSKLLGHNALSLSAIIANRARNEFSADPNAVIEDLILYTLDKIAVL